MIYKERPGTSGELPPEKRPKLAELLRDVQAGLIERLVVRHQFRLARGDELVPLLQRFRKARVGVLDFRLNEIRVDSAADRFNQRVQAAAGKYETELAGERGRETRRRRAHEGVHVGPAPFGYTSQSRMRRELISPGMTDEQVEEANRRAQDKLPRSPWLYIDEAEASIVRSIFDLYEAGHGVRRVARELNDQGLRRRGLIWHPNTVRKVLHDPKVAGWTTFDEDAYDVGDPSSAPLHQQERYEGKHTAIISRERFERVDEKLKRRAEKLDINRQNTRIYPLTGVLVDVHGHRMKGRSSGGGAASYTCRHRAALGPDPARNGCDAPPMNAERAERLVSEALAELLSSPDRVLSLHQEHVERRAKEAPVRRQEVADLERELKGLRREREGVFKLLRDVDLAHEDYEAIASRTREINDRIKDAQTAIDAANRKVVPLRPKTLSRARVASFMASLAGRLVADPQRHRELLLRLRRRHHLEIRSLDGHRLSVSMSVSPLDLDEEGGDQAIAATDDQIVLTVEAGARPLTSAEWAAQENAKGHFCKCGCGHRITVLPRHRAPSVGIPGYLRGAGHHRMDMTAFVQDLNAEGFLTVAQAAVRLGVSENTVRRAEAKKWITPHWRTWGRRKPMRVYADADIPTLREQMVEAGFSFKDEKGVLTTAAMASALGISETHLRHLERRGVVPSPNRDTADRRRWLERDVAYIERRLADYRRSVRKSRKP